MKRLTIAATIAGTFAATLISGWALAGQPSGAGNEGRSGGHPGGRRGPPPEAIAACKASNTGDVCSFESPHGSLKGTCFAPDTEHPLACRPKGPPPPPQAAVDACEGLSSGEACLFEGKNGDVEGTCFTPNKGGADDRHPLACRPTNPPPGARGGQRPAFELEGE